MNRIEKYIEPAIKEIEAIAKDGKISKVYNGYLASMGASIVQSGLKVTLASFENNRERAEGDKSQITKAILNIIEPNNKYSSLLSFVLDNPKQEEYYKQKIIVIATALKLAIRTFELD
jgi:CRISPR-associated protein Cmr5